MTLDYQSTSPRQPPSTPPKTNSHPRILPGSVAPTTQRTVTTTAIAPQPGLMAQQQQPTLTSLSQKTIASTTETGTVAKRDSSTVKETETGNVTVIVMTRSETPETEAGTETLGTDVPTFSAAHTDEAMLRDHPLSFATTSPRMVPITCPLLAALNPTTGAEAHAAHPSTTVSSLHLMTEGPLSMTAVHLPLMTVVSPRMTAQ